MLVASESAVVRLGASPPPLPPKPSCLGCFMTGPDSGVRPQSLRSPQYRVNVLVHVPPQPCSASHPAGLTEQEVCESLGAML